MNIAAIVTWKNNGTRRPHGQTMGADGSGEFARVFMGDDVLDANTKMREFIKELLTQQEYRGHIEIRSAILNDEGYHGRPITIS